MLPPLLCAAPQGVDGDASVHDRVLWALHISGMDDLLKFLASAPAEQQWALHVLEIISLMFRDQVSVVGAGTTPAPHPAVLTPLPPHLAEPGAAGSAGTGPGRRGVRGGHAGAAESAATGAGRAESTGAAAPIQVGKGAGGGEGGQDPVAGPTLLILCIPKSRHSRFRGSYVIQGLKAIGEHDVVFHKGLHNVSAGMGSARGARYGVEGLSVVLRGHSSRSPLAPQLQSYSHDLGKETRRVPRRRWAPPEQGPPRRSARNVRLFLSHFCQDFLEGCYNRLMLLVKVRAGVTPPT